MTRALCIVGASGHKRETLGILRAVIQERGGWEFAGFVDDSGKASGLVRSLNAEIICRPIDLPSLGHDYVIGIGDPKTRRRLEGLLSPPLRAATLVHPNTTVLETARLAEGVIVAEGSCVGAGTTIGRHSHLNVGVVVGSNCTIGDFVSLSPGVIVEDGASIDDGAFIGTRAVVWSQARLGAGCVVGAGAIVRTMVGAREQRVGRS